MSCCNLLRYGEENVTWARTSSSPRISATVKPLETKCRRRCGDLRPSPLCRGRVTDPPPLSAIGASHESEVRTRRFVDLLVTVHESENGLTSSWSAGTPLDSSERNNSSNDKFGIRRIAQNIRLSQNSVKFIYYVITASFFMMRTFVFAVLLPSALAFSLISPLPLKGSSAFSPSGASIASSSAAGQLNRSTNPPFV